MRSLPSLATVVLVATLHPSLAGQIQGVATDRSGNPLSGVVVKRLSTGDSTTSAADGSWYLAWTTGATRRAASGIGPRGLLSRQDGRLALAANGFRIDGRNGLLGGSTTIPSMQLAPRAGDTSEDTLAMRWKGASFKTPFRADAPSEDLGRMALDTAGLARFEIRASRHVAMGLPCLRLDVVSIDSSRSDSTALRLHLSGSAAEMADLAVRIDIAQFHDAAGFSRPAKLDAAGMRHFLPRRISYGCSVDTACDRIVGTTYDWIVDIPLDSVVFTPASRLMIQLVFGRNLQAEDTSGSVIGVPKHDPFGGSDWSFRPHRRNATLDYGGVPEIAQSEADQHPMQVPLDPYIQLVRGGIPVYGRSPESED